MSFEIIRNNIVNVEADAIVNTANPMVAVGAGVDQAVYEAAGWDRLLEERRKIGVMKPGQVAATPGFDLRSKYILHTIGPAWYDGNHGERETLAKCYSASLALAKELGCESVAFPLMATGTYGFPKDEALRIAVSEISSFLLENEMEVILVVYNKEAFELSGKLFSDVKSYIEENEVIPEEARFGRLEDMEMDMGQPEEAVKLGKAQDIECDEAAPSFGLPDDNLEERLSHMDKTFQQYLFMLIDRRGLTDPEVYKKANIDRKLFSKIRNNVNYMPSKKTVFALAIALELNLDEVKDLLLRAGFAFSPSSRFDLIVKYFIETGNCNINEINTVLFEYDQPLLGA